MWKAIKGFEKQYQVSHTGLVRNVKTGLVLTPFWVGRKGKQYATVRLSTNPRVDVKLHRLVLETFIGVARKGLIACHIDDDTTNNNLVNLRWGTYQHNAQNTARAGKCGNQKLSVKEQAKIKALRLEGVSGTEVAQRFGVSPQRVCDIFKGRSALQGEAK